VREAAIAARGGSPGETLVSGRQRCALHDAVALPPARAPRLSGVSGCGRASVPYPPEASLCVSLSLLSITISIINGIIIIIVWRERETCVVESRSRARRAPLRRYELLLLVIVIGYSYLGRFLTLTINNM